MDWNEMLARAKAEIVRIDPTADPTRLDNFWAGSVMEIQRILFRSMDADILYMVEINTMSEQVAAKKYLPQ